MCGIFAFLNSVLSEEQMRRLHNSFMKGNGRGPEYSFLDKVYNGTYVGFHRLAINGLNPESNQPFFYNGCVLVCNGEIYNYRDLIEEHDLKVISDSDCEVIIHLYQKYGFDYILNMLDGVFAFVLIDLRESEPVMHVARDPFGVRPLFKFTNVTESRVDDDGTPGVLLDDPDNDIMGFTSVMKMIVPFEHAMRHTYKLEQFIPGTYETYKLIDSKWRFQTSDRFFQLCTKPYIFTKDDALTIIRSSLMDAVKKRVLTTERPIACLLSGGLDSSLICALVNRFYKDTDTVLETYSIGLEGSEDLKYARKVAKHIKSKHTEIIVKEEDFLDAIPEVINVIESYDTTTVRASVGNYLVSKYIAAHSDAKVIFNGDGSDEVCGGYMYFHKAPTPTHMDHECRRLLKDICYFDVLRSDRSISSNGLEARTPFLDRTFVDNYFSIIPDLRCVVKHNYMEKWLLRSAFDGMDLLPKEILWRTKEAFSDGVSAMERSWYQIIQEHMEKLNIADGEDTRENRYYRSVYESMYGAKNVIPYKWMPKFVEGATDASARTLNVYKEKMAGGEDDVE